MPNLIGESGSGVKIVDNNVERYTLKTLLAPLPSDCEDLTFPKNSTFLILGAAAAISAGLLATFLLEGYSAIQITPAKRTAWKNEHEIEADFSSEESLKSLKDLVCEKHQPGAIINLLNFANLDNLYSDNQSKRAYAEIFFMTLKIFVNELRDSVKENAGWIINFTCMGGKFGLESDKEFNPLQAGSIGVAKTVSREWPGARVKCIDIDDELDPHMLLPLIFEELTTSDSELEVGFTSKGRWRVLQEKTELPTSLRIPDNNNIIQLDKGAVIVITGGAYGITAEFAQYFSTYHKATLILLGRSPLPEKESLETANFLDHTGLRNYLINKSNENKIKASPAEIEKSIGKILRNRKILQNLQNMKNTGSQIEYFSVDVSDEFAFQKMIDHIYTDFGRIDGVIHGAGIIEDKLISKKTLNSFRRVFNTKTVAVEVLLKSLQSDKLKFILLFSSVAARYGNVGQADYSAANEVLNKAAQCLKKQHPQSKVTSINWGPWDAGMVTKSLSKLYSTQGIGLIPVPVGIQLGIAELCKNETNTNTEVLIAADVKRISKWGLGT